MTTVAAAVLAELFGVTPRRLRDLAKAGVVQSAGRGTYELQASIKSYIAHLREQAAGRLGHDASLDPVHENAAHKRSMTALNDLKRAEMEGRLVAVEDLAPAWARAAQAIKLAVLALPGRARSALPHLTAHDGEVLDGLCRDALEQARATVMPTTAIGDVDVD